MALQKLDKFLTPHLQGGNNNHVEEYKMESMNNNDENEGIRDEDVGNGEANISNFYNSWSKNSTKALIYAYNIHRSKVGSFEMKTLKKMWEAIALYLQTNYNLRYTPMNCENRWRVLERNYKKYVDNNTKTGRRRKFFEFSEEMGEIFLKKSNIHPDILLSANETFQNDSSATCSEINQGEQSNGNANENVELDSDMLNINDRENNETSKINKKVLKKKNSITTPRVDILEEIRNDRLKYQSEILKLQMKMIKEKFELEKQKLMEKKRKNDLIEKRNKLLEEILKKEALKTGEILSLL